MKAIVKFSVGILASLVLALHVSAQPSSEKVDQPSPELRAAAVEMLDAVNLRQMMNQMSSAMAQATPQMLEQMSGKMFDKLPPEQQKVAKEKAASAAKAAADRAMAIYRDPEVIQGMEDIMVRAYVRRFTLAEIKSITAFYKSEAGKKMMAATPQMMQEMMPELMALTAPKMNALMEDMMKAAIEDTKAASANNKTPAKK